MTPIPCAYAASRPLEHVDLFAHQWAWQPSACLVAAGTAQDAADVDEWYFYNDGGNSNGELVTRRLVQPAYSHCGQPGAGVAAQ